jgi:membrane-associated phospholipid phosphatase
MTTNRRTTARGLLTASVLAATGGLSVRAAAAAARPAAVPVEPGAGGWSTWVLRSGGELRPSPPPTGAAASGELAELKALAGQRDATAVDRIGYWDAGAPGYRWNELATAQAIRAPVAVRGYRTLGLVNVAIHDATVAAWAAKYAFNRPRPAEADPSLVTVLPTPPSPSYPAEHAAAAGAAAAVLAHLYPERAAAVAALADEAAQSRVLAGVQYPSDVRAGLELGRAVAARVVEWAQRDGSDAVWTGSVPEGPGLWRGTPTEPAMGTWRTWALTSGSELRLGPPPAPDSEQRAAELAEVKAVVRDANLGQAGVFWPEDPVGRPSPGAAPVAVPQVVFHYAAQTYLQMHALLHRKLAESRRDANPPWAARAYALLSVAAYDASVAAWDSKFHYWVGRPVHFDPGLAPLLPINSHPDYPSAHATQAGAAEAVLAHLFPRDAAYFAAWAEELAASRVWTGSHFRSACEAGLALGRAVGRRAIERALPEGAR